MLKEGQKGGKNLYFDNCKNIQGVRKTVVLTKNLFKRVEKATYINISTNIITSLYCLLLISYILYLLFFAFIFVRVCL